MVLNSILTDGNPKLDGFGSGLYVACWDFVKEDMMEVAKDF